jgi:hypothetical protein
MKKVLILLLILAVAGGAFAQESSVKISGSVNTGLENRYTTVDAEDWGLGDVTDQDFYAKAHDADVDNIRADINVDAEVDENVSVHAKFRLQPGGSSLASNHFYVPYAYGKVTTFGIVDIYGGLVDNEAWKTAGDEADDVGEGLGGLIQIRPIEGLNIGFGVYDTDPNQPNGTIFLDTSFTYGASYTMADTFRAEISGQTQGQMMQKIFAGAEIFAIPNLSLALEVFSTTLSNEDAGWTIDEKASYDLGALDIGLTLWQFINLPNLGPVGDVTRRALNNSGWNISQADWDALAWKEFLLGLKANLWASYEIGAFVPKLEIYGGYGGISEDGTGYEKLTVIYLGAKPSVTWNVGTNAKLVGAYDFGWGQGDIDGDKAKVSEHKVYVDFIYSF